MKMLCLCALNLRELRGERVYIQSTDRDGVSVEGGQWGPNSKSLPRPHKRLIHLWTTYCISNLSNYSPKSELFIASNTSSNCINAI